ncbi:hypothetical protein [Agrilactobacillus composti]
MTVLVDADGKPLLNKVD